MPTRCTATTAAGSPCKAWARSGSNPPRCAAHPTDPTAPRPGAPAGNTNAVTHGAYRAPPSGAASLTSVIDTLRTRITDLDSYIDTSELAPDQYIDALNLLSLLATRLGRLLRDNAALTGTAQTDLEAAIADALDVVGQQLGAPL